MAAAAQRLTRSELIRLFASKMAESRPGTPLARARDAQLPYFQ